jgi:hypothetical protein
VITTSITAAAFAAMEATLPAGSKARARLDGKGGLSGHCMPRGCRIDIDPFPSALTASNSLACLGDDDCLGQHVHVHVGFVPASLTYCDNGVDAIPAQREYDTGGSCRATEGHRRGIGSSMAQGALLAAAISRLSCGKFRAAS